MYVEPCSRYLWVLGPILPILFWQIWLLRYALAWAMPMFGPCPWLGHALLLRAMPVCCGPCPFDGPCPKIGHAYLIAKGPCPLDVEKGHKSHFPGPCHLVSLDSAMQRSVQSPKRAAMARARGRMGEWNKGKNGSLLERAPA